MGTYNYLYVGIYLEIPHQKKKVERKVFKKPSGKISKTRFNPETGEEYKEDVIVETIHSSVSPYISGHDTLQEDMFWEPAYHAGDKTSIFLFNESGIYGKTYGTNDFVNIIISNEDNFDALVAEFSNRYKDYLDYYRQSCDDLEVRYGIISYAH